MKVIWKFELQTVDRQVIKMPLGSKILTVQTQNDVPVLWALVDTDMAPQEDKVIDVYGTGNDVDFLSDGYIFPDTEREYIGTYQLDGGSFIGHVFERITN